jgi:CBS domain containing-hemolysin-like protein
MIEVILILISLGLVLACGFFVAAEFALVTVDRTRAERLALKGDKRAGGVLKALQSLSTQLSGSQIGITITNLSIGFLAEPSIASLLREPLGAVGLSGTAVTTVSITIAIILATLVTMLFGELVPKNLAISNPLTTAKYIQGLQRGFSRLMHYPIIFMNGAANRILRAFNITPQEELASARSVEELLSVVRHSAQQGTIEKDTALLVERSIEFSERHASDVMTPRVTLEVVSLDSPVNAVIEAVKKSGYSRFPVIDKTIDNVVGMVHINHAVAVPFDQRAEVTVKSVMQPVHFTPSSIELIDLIEKMRDESIEEMVTIDEFGGVDGLVTLEDLIEELVGEVKDEHDESGIAVKSTGRQSWSVLGLLRPDEISQVIGLFLPESDEFETIGGLVLDGLDEVPRVGDSIQVGAMDRKGKRWNVRLLVTRMDGRRIDRLELTRLKRKGRKK